MYFSVDHDHVCALVWHVCTIGHFYCFKRKRLLILTTYIVTAVHNYLSLTTNRLWLITCMVSALLSPGLQASYVVTCNRLPSV